MTDDAQPTAEDLAKAGQVSAAAADAIQNAESREDAREKAGQAVRSKSDEVGLKLSDDDCNKLVDMLIDRMSALGAFDAPPAAPAAQPPAQVAAHATPEDAAAATAAAEAATAPPQKKTLAERFAGI